MMLVAGFQARCHPLCIIIIITGLLVYYIIIIIITLQLVKLNRLSKSNVILLLHIAYTHILQLPDVRFSVNTLFDRLFDSGTCLFNRKLWQESINGMK